MRKSGIRSPIAACGCRRGCDRPAISSIPDSFPVSRPTCRAPPLEGFRQCAERRCRLARSRDRRSIRSGTSHGQRHPVPKRAALPAPRHPKNTMNRNANAWLAGPNGPLVSVVTAVGGDVWLHPDGHLRRVRKAVSSDRQHPCSRGNHAGLTRYNPALLWSGLTWCVDRVAQACSALNEWVVAGRPGWASSPRSTEYGRASPARPHRQGEGR
jgi:hypothetical protein